MSLPTTYRAAVLETFGSPFVMKDLPLKLPSPGEILVKVIATGVCAGDHAVQHGQIPTPLPLVLGHETIGAIAAVPENEDHFTVGQRVGAPWHGGHCGFCRQCKHGVFQMCTTQIINGVSRDGGFAEYILLRREAVVHVPEALDPVKYCPVLCAGVTVFNGLRKMQIGPGSLVAVQGIGGLGHLAIQYAAKMGHQVVVLSRGPEKEAFARQLGASHYIDTEKSESGGVVELQALGGAALILTTAPSGSVIAPLLGGLMHGGKLLILGAAGEVTFNTLPMLFKGLSIHGWPSGHSIDSEEALKFCENHGVDCMVESYPLEKVNQAMEDMMAGKPRFRAVLKISDTPI
ncbi:GroES-like protein [Lophium mytilinum]|uniref:GroES-like protein n=1 Tax=Lophium mytilinum TaxID=390894 RepID=A0A6A6QI05_9PEZI|nr:GroES-like protein [Lophium mytilinum]